MRSRSRSSETVAEPRALFREYLRRHRARLALDRLELHQSAAAFRRLEERLARDLETGRQTWLPIALEPEQEGATP
jgi:hypothetical protein